MEIAHVTMRCNPPRPNQEPPARLVPRDGNRPRYHALQSTSAEPRRATLTMRAGSFWSAPPVEVLREWLERADIKEGPVFRGINRWGAGEDEALTSQSINLIRQTGLRHVGIGAGGLFGAGTARGITDRGGAARDRAAGGDATVPTRPIQQAASYYTEAERAQGTTARFYDAANGMTVRAVLSADNIVPA
jgi:hypothetical protein